MPKKSNYNPIKLRYRLTRSRAAILDRLHQLVDPELRLSYGQLLDYCVDWVARRLDANVVWRSEVARYRRWTRKEIDILGTYPDAIVALQLRRQVNSVRRKRDSLGIPEYDSKIVFSDGADRTTAY